MNTPRENLIHRLCLATSCQYHLDYTDKLEELLSFIKTIEKEARQEGREETKNTILIEIQEKIDSGSTTIDEDFLQFISSLK